MSVAVVITHNRPELLRECVDAIASQVDVVVIIDNASEPPVEPIGSLILRDPRQPPNIARMWNDGLDAARMLQADDPYVAFLCDDAIVPEGWFAAVTGAMAETGAAAGCSDPLGTVHPPQLKTAPDRDLWGRMVGWAFVLDATKGIRADERLHWWWCDTDVDWQARARGGTVMIGEYAVPNRLPNDFTNARPELGERTGIDGMTFVEKWGFRPW